MFASKPSIKDFALKLPNVAVATATADACATELVVIESGSEVFRMSRGRWLASYASLDSSAGSHLHDHLPTFTTTYLRGSFIHEHDSVTDDF